ncbi:uncharacterized protein LOC117595394 [Esox lucius]|uniref:uncharacterized protein LOC117595394 n=1 Tax=Esox lucius TaxID=8010 RepID=UPI0014775D2A|nr:uncharacterized protein LOC117595394 [Esox lucius]
MFISYTCFDLVWAVYVMASLAHSESHLIKHAECNEDISMNCEAVKNNMHKSITWYKLNNRTGIIRKRDNNVPEKYDYPRPAWFGENDSLVLPRVRPEDSGTYECLIRAEIGKINRKSSVILHVSTVCDTLTTMTALVKECQNMTHSSPMYPIQVLEVSTVWTSCGFLIMVLVKITLCIISIGVVGEIKKSHSRRKQHW